MDRLDLRLVEYFVVVAEELHFSRAAERLHIAQPSLSQQIRRLESQLGVTLLERTSRRVELTAAGEVLLREGRRTLNHARRTIQAVRDAGSEQLVVGFLGSAASTLLPDVLRTHEQRRPNVRVSLRELGFADVDELLDGGVDLAFTRLLPGQTELELEVLGDEARVVALPAAHPLTARESLTFADLRDEAFITNPTTQTSDPPARWLAEQRRHGLPGRVAAKAASIQEILTLVATGRGVCLVPMSVARHHPRADVRYVEVSDADRAVVSLAWSPVNQRPAVAAFIETTREVAAAQRDRTVGSSPRLPLRAAALR
ncbi:MAG TPA: LysR substrate-binding domain-containing protein [Conexibacter sp.]|jgi:DNA-binding transcriptional LysR family regulator|nr:LysR substrate-binding domain-containing protein [Conexibacter sp.]